MNDLKFALRQVRRNPGFAAVAILTLALGIGATTALFSVVHAVLVDPYPYARPGEIWVPGLQSTGGEQRIRPYRMAEYRQMMELPVFASVMATGPGAVLLTGDFPPESVRGVRISPNGFEFLGVAPILGRTIGASDYHASGEPERVTVLSYQRWQKLFGGSPSALGRTLRLDDQTYTVIGVMPPRFGWWTGDGLWLPMDLKAADAPSVFPIARLKAGVAAAAATEQLDAAQQEFARVNPNGFPREKFTTRLTNYLDLTVASGEMERSLWMLVGAVGCLLLIACANVANLQLARASSRAREIAIRLSMGARRSRIVRQLLTESVVISLLGGVLGLLFVFWIIRLMVALMPDFNVPNEARIEVNSYVLWFCVGVSVLTGVGFGLTPAFHACRAGTGQALQDQSRGSSASSGTRMRGALVIAEVVLSVVLLVAAGLTLRSFIALQNVELGFRPERVMTIGVPLAAKRYDTIEKRNRFARELLERVSRIPGVEAASIGNGGMPFGGPRTTVGIDNQAASTSGEVIVHLAAQNYLRALGVPLRSGRFPTEQEINASEPLAVINEAAAKLWPAGTDPLGRSLRLDEFTRGPRGDALFPTNSTGIVTVVGVMADIRNDGISSEPLPAVVVPYTLAAPAQRGMIIRALGDPTQLMNALRAQVREMDSQQPINGPTTIATILDSRTAQPRFIMSLFIVFASLGLALAMAGIYSVLSYLVSRRTREIGVRIALGAQRADVLRMIFGAAGRLVGIGAVIGIVASLGVARLLRSQVELYQVPTVDPVAFLGVLALLGGVAAAACLVPALRAAGIQPMEALRRE